MNDKSIAFKIMHRIKRYSRGQKVFCAQDFFDLGNRASVDQALSRLTRTGQIRRVARGLYDWPYTLIIRKSSGVLKKVAPPDHFSALKAIARKNDIKIYPNGLAAANSYGLTTAVPVQPIYTTDGSSRTLKIGNNTIILQKAPQKVLAWSNRPAFNVVQALFWLGKTRVGSPDVAKELQRLPDNVKQDLSRGIHMLPSWAMPVVTNTLCVR